jgi:hypothetical protein
VRSWSRAKRQRKKLPRCARCENPIPRSEPDAVLVDHATGKKRFYHVRCASAMGKLVKPGSVYSVFYRDVNPEAN